MVDNKVRVLLVDDDEDDYLITSDLFEDIESNYEYQLEWVDNFDDACTAIKAQNHHIYLLDYRLGQYTGIDILQRAINEGLVGPFILLTGQGEHEIDLKAMELGASDYLVKGEMTAKLLERAVRYAIERHRTTAQLQASEALYRDLFENASDLIQSIDAKGNIEYVNQRWLDVMGYTSEELAGLNLFDILREDLVDHCRSVMDHLSLGGAQTNMRLVYITKMGEEIYLEGNVTPRFGDNGEFLSTRGIFHDVSERILYEKALEKSEARLQATIDSALDGIISIDSQSRIIEFNPAAEAMFGYKAEDIIDHDMAELIVPPTYREQHRAGMARLLRTGEPRILEQRLELEGWHAEGRTFPIEITVVPILNEDGATFTAFVRDITERKEAEAKLQQSEKLYRGVVDTQTEMVCRYLPDTTLTFANEAYCKHYGLQPENVVGTSILTLYPEAEWPKFKQHIANITENATTVINEYQNTTSTGELAWYLWTDQAITNAKGEVVEIQAVGRDITPIKQAQIELEKALAKEKELGELKSRFVSIASHEFRTPLTTIMSTASFLEVADDKMTPEKRIERLQKIQTASATMTELLEDVLVYGKADAGHLSFEPTALCLSNFVKQLIDDLQTVAPTHQFVLENELPHENYFLLDEKLLRQILTNLLTNAVKYSPGADKVLIRLFEDKQTLYTQITDYGMGIPERDQVHLFTPFHRAKNTQNIAGTGLGLVIAQKAIEAHGGHIEFESELDAGTTFTLSLPKHST